MGYRENTLHFLAVSQCPNTASHNASKCKSCLKLWKSLISDYKKVKRGELNTHQAMIKILDHQYRWLAGWVWPKNRTFLEMASMVVSCWIVAFCGVLIIVLPTPLPPKPLPHVSFCLFLCAGAGSQSTLYLLHFSALRHYTCQPCNSGYHAIL